MISPKVRDACRIVLIQGYKYIWIDSESCCIDKSSSTELSEAINSMYLWYCEAAVCYAFLTDVSSGDNLQSANSKFRMSKWFSWAWTLQELIAPKVVIFLSGEWTTLDSKLNLATVVVEITCIECNILCRRKELADVSVARCMSWAATRVSTQLEDWAYSLLSIFNITMPTLYGEGGHAFIHLQQEILKQIPDQSLFTWGPSFPLLPSSLQLDTAGKVSSFHYKLEMTTPSESLFAALPDQFKESASILHISYDEFLHQLGLLDLGLPIYDESPYGVHTQLPLISLRTLFPSMSFINKLPSGHECVPLQFPVVLLSCP